MSLANLAIAQKYILDKGAWIIKHRLQKKIDDFNTSEQFSGDIAVKYPRTVNTSNTINLFSGSPSIDGFPVINIFEASNTISTMDFQENRDHDVVLNITAAEMCDVADVEFAVNRSRMLACLSCDVLEEYYKDPFVQPNGTEYGIYRVDTINGAAGGVQPLKGNMMVAAFSMQIRVKMRSRYEDSRSMMSDSSLATPFVPGPFVPSLLDPGNIEINFDNAALNKLVGNNSFVAVDYTAANKAASTGVVLSAPNMPANSIAYATNQSTLQSARAIISGAGGTFSFLFSSVPVNSTDSWTIDCIDPITKVLAAYTILWTQI